MTVSLVQNFFKQTVTTPWTTGTGNFYVSQKPDVTSGFLVISPNSESLREIVAFSAVGTDGGGDYVTVSARGLGGTTEQAHGAGEKVYMNITAQHIEQIKQAIEDINNAGALNASTTVKGVARLTASPNVSLGNPTITIASPAVVTLTAHGLTENDEIQFTTTGALPTGISASTTYYVISTGLTANTFQFSATFGGTAVNTSGSQSGTHTLTRITPRAVSENDTKLPTQSQKDAMATISTPPSSANKFVTQADIASVLKTFANSNTFGSSTSQFDITNPAGTTFRYTWDGTGTNPNINTTTVPVGTTLYVNGQNFNANNKGAFTVTGSGANYFEVTNASGVAETNVTIGTGAINYCWIKPANLKEVVVRGMGGGGGGGGGRAGYQQGGGGGGGGGYFEFMVPASALPAFAIVVVGAGGAAGALDASGTTGTASTFNGITIGAGGGGGISGSTTRDGGGGGGIKTSGSGLNGGVDGAAIFDGRNGAATNVVGVAGIHFGGAGGAGGSSSSSAGVAGIAAANGVYGGGSGSGGGTSGGAVQPAGTSMFNGTYGQGGIGGRGSTSDATAGLSGFVSVTEYF